MARGVVWLAVFAGLWRLVRIDRACFSVILMTCPLLGLEPDCTSTLGPIASVGSTGLAPIMSTLLQRRPSTGHQARSSTLPRTRNIDGTTMQFTLALPCSNTVWTSISRTFKSLEDWGCELARWANVSIRRPDPVSDLSTDPLPLQDICSYDVEQSKVPEGNNILTVLMEANGSDLREAADHAGVHFGGLVSRFIAERNKLPSGRPDLDRDVSCYVDAISCRVIGNACWSFETLRYFGSPLEDVGRTRIVKLCPRETETGSDEIFLTRNPLETFTLPIQRSFGPGVNVIPGHL